MSRFDDPIEADRDQVAWEQREDAFSLGPFNQCKNTFKEVLRGLLQQASSSGLLTSMSLATSLLEAWHEDQSARTTKNQNYLLNAVVETVQIVDREIDKHADRLSRLEVGLGQALPYVGATTSREKLDHFAAIVVSGASVFYQTDSREQTEEFLSIAAALQRTDVLVLREIGEAHTIAAKGLIRPDEILPSVQAGWSELLRNLDQCGISALNYKSAFVRLQSHGLLERTEMNGNVNRPGETPYLLLELGQKFLNYLADHHSKEESAKVNWNA